MSGPTKKQLQDRVNGHFLTIGELKQNIERLNLEIEANYKAKLAAKEFYGKEMAVLDGVRFRDIEALQEKVDGLMALNSTHEKYLKLMLHMANPPMVVRGDAELMRLANMRRQEEEWDTPTMGGCSPSPFSDGG